MKKGFDYWMSDKVLAFVKIYWIVYSIFYLLAVWLSISGRNPFIFLLIGFLPYIMIHAYKTMHNPSHNLKEDMEKIEPGLFELISQQKLKLNINKNAVNQQQQSGLIYAGLMLLDENDVDRRISAFVYNNKRINLSSMASLAIWFFTFLILLFILFLKR